MPDGMLADNAEENYRVVALVALAGDIPGLDCGYIFSVLKPIMMQPQILPG